MKLPNGERAEIPEPKLREYLLSASHPIGRFKARFFRSIGYTDENWQALADQLAHLAVSSDAEEIPSAHGTKFKIVGSLSAGDIQPAQVVTIWIVSQETSAPRFVTAYPLD